ncbi:hypothetical protein LIER_28765 [Lithospermum erythrorhizon]|uniref:Tf2-1-like SH3-like domain-containing protein n=1 Tax=Lithospermum erythrorhizon TaxID=34254 RepID=A0AAV3RIF5_LITER
MSSFEALYGLRCRTPVCWNEVLDKKIYGSELVGKSVERIKLTQQHLKTAPDRQKKYADRHQIDLSFEVGDKVFLRISPWKDVSRFGKKEKLSPRYIGPYEIIAKVGSVAYRVALPSKLQRIHNVSMYFVFESLFLMNPTFSSLDRLNLENALRMKRT